MVEPVREFQGEYRFLSNFWPCQIEFQGLVFPSVEHAYVASKTENASKRRMVAALPSAGDAKRYGRSFKLRDDWEDVKLGLMLDFLRKKFHTEYLADKLVATAPRILIEGNRWGDTFWGMCSGVGQNNLGKLLMQVRDELQGS